MAWKRKANSEVKASDKTVIMWQKKVNLASHRSHCHFIHVGGHWAGRGEDGGLRQRDVRLQLLGGGGGPAPQPAHHPPGPPRQAPGEQQQGAEEDARTQRGLPGDRGAYNIRA